MNDFQRFVIEFEALPDELPPEIRVRSLLKYALRRLRLRNQGIRSAPDGTGPPPRSEGDPGLPSRAPSTRQKRT